MAAFEAAVNRSPQELETTMRHKDGHILELSVTAVPVIVGDEVVGVHGLAENVTERNEMRRELERTRRAAEEANAAKSLFLANMSHEVRTPLTSVLGAAEMLAEAGIDPDQAALVAIVQRSAEKLHRLVNDILDVSRLEAGRLEVEEDADEPPGRRGRRHHVGRAARAPRGAHLHLVAGPGPAASGVRRRDAHLPGADEPDRQRPEVHRAGRGRLTVEVAARLEHIGGRAVHRRGLRDRHRRGPARAPCSSRSRRSTRRPPASTAAPGSAWRSVTSWST